MVADFRALCITPFVSIRQVIDCIDRNQKGIALVTDEECRLLGTITDGDVRRGILADVDLEAPVADLLARKVRPSCPEPVSAPAGSGAALLLRLMRDKQVRQIPLVDKAQRVVGLVTLDELLPTDVLPVQAIVMAGGTGTRLRPLTEDLPKPMLPVGGRPLMELTIEQLRQCGIRRVHVATYYKADKIVEHFGDGHAFGVELSYLNEELPLGTAGGIGLMSAPTEPMLVINGDILTQVDFRAMLGYHQDHEAVLTVAVRKYEINMPYGVIESDGPLVRRLIEKPIMSFFVNAGIYLLEPLVYEYLPNGQRCDMTDLIQRLVADGRVVVSFPVREYWLDIGHIGDYERAQEDLKNGALKL